MADPADPAETTFQRLLNHEILVSERRRMLTLAALQAFILVLILLIATLAPGFVRSIYHDRLPERAALTALSAFIAYELFGFFFKFWFCGHAVKVPATATGYACCPRCVDRRPSA